jgi:regulator of protease activity HflC (stomatin/prohibitin superfamily)
MIFVDTIKEYERAVVFKLGKIVGPARGPGLIFIAPFVLFPAPLRSTIAELGAFLARESRAARR